LAGCPVCSATLEDLKVVVSQARSLQDQPPAKDLWNGIAQRIVPPPATTRAPVSRWRERRFSFSIPQLAAAGIALLLVVGGVARWAWSASSTVSSTDVAATDRGSVPALTAGPGPVSLAAFSGSDSAVAQLERALEAGRGRLDTATVRIIRENLQI